MLVEFTVRNYRSFRDRFTWSMEPEERLSERDDAVNEANLMPTDHGPLLRVAAVYGANASGKTNLIRALWELRGHVLGSATDSQAGAGFYFRGFRLDPMKAAEPTELEVVLLHGGRQYRYGARVAPDRVVSEWLWSSEPGAEQEELGFERDAQAYRVGPGWPRDEALEARTRSDALHLSVLAQFNHAVGSQVVGWFLRLNIINGLSSMSLDDTVRMLDDPRAAAAIRALVRNADFGLADIRAEREELPRRPPELSPDLYAIYQRYQPTRLVFERNAVGPDGESRSYTFEAGDESAGTLKVAQLAGPVLEALMNGSVLVVDELDARLHTLLAMEIVKLFQDPASNPHGAQLLFASHDTNLLTRSLLRRDQLWFAEKDRKTGASDLYSLAEVRDDGGKRVRNDRSYERDYLQGRYGAVPFFGNLRALVGQALTEDES